MPRLPPASPLSKVTYRPIEAAIRWSGLAQYEAQILEQLNGRRLPEADEFLKWPKLRLNAERIDDGIANRDLRIAINGVAINDRANADDPNFTVRHLDLKAWMSRFYPDERPPFLFSRLERNTHPFMSLEAVQALFLERDALRLRIEQREQELQRLRTQRRAGNSRLTVAPDAANALSPRSEMTYLHIIGAFLGLILGQSPAGQPYSSFRSQEAIISALTALHGERLGITERTLQAKFAAARRALDK